MPFQLAQLLVSLMADDSDLTEALGRARASLAALDESASAALKLEVPTGPLQQMVDSLKEMRSLLSKSVPAARVAEPFKEVGEVMENLGGEVEKANGRAAASQGPLQSLRSSWEGVGTVIRNSASGVRTVAGATGGLVSAMMAAGGHAGGFSSKFSEAMHTAGAGAQSLDTALVAVLRRCAALAGLDMNQLLGLGSLAGLAGGAWMVAQRFMDVSDEAMLMPARLKNLGLAADDAYKHFKDFQNEVSATGIASRETVKHVTELAAMRGPERMRGQYQDLVLAAQAISAATGHTLDFTSRWVNMGEENYENYRRLLKLAGEQVPPHATQAQIMERVNRLIQRGTELQKVQGETFGAQWIKLRNAFDLLFETFSRAAGGALVEPIKALAQWVTEGARRLNDFVAANKEHIAQWSRVATAIAAAVAGGTAFRMALGLIRTLGPQVLFSLLPVGPLLNALGGPAVRLGTTFLALGGVLKSAFLLPFTLVRGTVSTLISLVGGGLTRAIGGLVLAIRGVGTAVRVAIAGTGVGIIVAVIGTLAALAISLIDTGDAAATFWDRLKFAAKPVADFLTGVWKTFKTEAQVAFKAVQLGWSSLTATIHRVLGDLAERVTGDRKGLEKGLAGFLTERVLPVWREVTGTIRRLWNTVLEEVSIAGLRIEQAALYAQAAWMMLPEVWEYILLAAHSMTTQLYAKVELLYAKLTAAWQVFSVRITGLALAAVAYLLLKLGQKLVEGIVWVHVQFAKLLPTLVEMAVRAFTLMRNQIAGIFQGLLEFLKDPRKGLPAAFSAEGMKQAIDELKAEFADTFEHLQLPEFKLEVPDDIQKKLKAIDEEMAKARDRNRKALEEERQRLLETLKKKPDASPRAPNLGGGRLIPGGFMELTAQWKKIQEAAAGGAMQTLEELQKRQLTESERQTKVLEQIRDRPEPAAETPPAIPG